MSDKIMLVNSHKLVFNERVHLLHAKWTQEGLLTPTAQRSACTT